MNALRKRGAIGRVIEKLLSKYRSISEYHLQALLSLPALGLKEKKWQRSKKRSVKAPTKKEARRPKRSRSRRGAEEKHEYQWSDKSLTMTPMEKRMRGMRRRWNRIAGEGSFGYR